MKNLAGFTKSQQIVIVFAMGVWFLSQVLTLFNLLAFTPDRPNPSPMPKPAPSQIPTLMRECQFGTITQTGRTFAIIGDRWSGSGKIADNGRRVVISWVQLETGREAAGVYVLTNGELVGHYQFVDETEEQKHSETLISQDRR